MMNAPNRGGSAALSRFMLGLGPALMKVVMKQSRSRVLEPSGRRRVWASSSSPARRRWTSGFAGKISPRAGKLAGAATFLGDALDGKVSYFI
jgi:hypothetical protein